jgi:hypothetical protein
MSHTQIISYHPHYLEAAARLYQQAYALRDYDQFDAFETSLHILMDYTRRESFIGVLALTAEQEVIGWASGFATPADNPRMAAIISKRIGPQWLEQCFMIESFATHFEHQSPALSQTLHAGLLKRVREAGYLRARMRVDVPRLDHLEASLQAAGWAEFAALSGLPHVKWYGQEF